MDRKSSTITTTNLPGQCFKWLFPINFKPQPSTLRWTFAHQGILFRGQSHLCLYFFSRDINLLSSGTTLTLKVLILPSGLSCKVGIWNCHLGIYQHVSLPLCELWSQKALPYDFECLPSAALSHKRDHIPQKGPHPTTGHLLSLSIYSQWMLFNNRDLPNLQ